MRGTFSDLNEQREKLLDVMSSNGNSICDEIWTNDGDKRVEISSWLDSINLQIELAREAATSDKELPFDMEMMRTMTWMYFDGFKNTESKSKAKKIPKRNRSNSTIEVGNVDVDGELKHIEEFRNRRIPREG